MIVETQRVTKIIKKYSSIGKTPIHKPKLFSGRKIQTCVFVAQISQGMLKIKAPTIHKISVFLKRRKRSKLKNQRAASGSQTKIVSQGRYFISNLISPKPSVAGGVIDYCLAEFFRGVIWKVARLPIEFGVTNLPGHQSTCSLFS